MAVVAFDPAAFVVRYPEFAPVSNALLRACFEEAGLYLSNTDCSPVTNLSRREMLLWMLTAHIAYLGGALNACGAGGGGGPLPVGRTSSATEGSVSVSFDYAGVPGTAAWFSMSQWGAAFWQATLSLRSFRYRPRATRY